MLDSIHPSHQVAISAAWWKEWKEVPLLEAPPHFTPATTTSSSNLSHPATISDASWWEGWKKGLSTTTPPAVESSSTAGGMPTPLVDVTSTSGGESPPVVDRVQLYYRRDFVMPL